MFALAVNLRHHKGNLHNVQPVQRQPQPGATCRVQWAAAAALPGQPRTFRPQRGRMFAGQPPCAFPGTTAADVVSLPERSAVPADPRSQPPKLGRHGAVLQAGAGVRSGSETAPAPARGAGAERTGGGQAAGLRLTREARATARADRTPELDPARCPTDPKAVPVKWAWSGYRTREPDPDRSAARLLP